ncbi:MAG: hypothetical protein IJE14_08660 [Clostridia bacterium]|nr:hypothetical protein [Clostridia bacterium]
MQKNKAEKFNKKSFAQMLKEPKVMQAAIMLAVSSLVLAIAVFSLNSLGFFHMLAGFTIPRGAVKQGVIYEKNQITEIPEGEIRYRLNTDIVFDNLYCRGSIMLENPKVSEYDLEFKFYLPKNQSDPIYESPRLKPGECILNDKLTDKLSLKKGDYTCICVVSAYNEKGEYCGRNTCTVYIDILDN